MQVILLERVEKLGQMGQVVNVKAGFARNYLLPQRKALRATKENVAQFETQRVQLEAQNLERRQEAETVSAKMEGLSVVIVRQASDSDQLYGSVTTRDIAEAVGAAGFTVDKRQVQLERPIKSVALHPVRINLHPEVSVVITVNVARSQEEAEAQARGERLTGEEEIEEPTLEAAALFEEGQAPEAEELDPQIEPAEAEASEESADLEDAER